MKKLVYPLSLVMIAAAITACGNNTAGPEDGAQTQGVRYQANTRNPANTQGNYSNTGTLGAGIANNGTRNNRMRTYNGTRVNGYNRALADRLAVAADRVPGVQRATAIVYGNDVVIGVDTRFGTMNDTNQRRVVEQQVHAAARAIAPHYTIRVTSERNMLTRIRNLDNTFRGNIMTDNRPGIGGAGADNNGGFGGGIMRGNGNAPFMGGPNTVAGNLGNAGNDFASLVRDLGRTVTAPFR